MEIVKTPIADLFILKPRLFRDDRGFFYESYNQKKFFELGLKEQYVQDNHSRSYRGVLRGLHFQTGASAQAKLVTVLSGEVFDVAVDLRPQSPTLGQHLSCILKAEDPTYFLIPRGFAHGFQVLSESADFLYKVDNDYDPKAEAGILWSDADLKIKWPISAAIVSEKDRALPSFKDSKGVL